MTRPGVIVAEPCDRYRACVEASRDEIFIVDRDNRVEYVNRTAVDALGLRLPVEGRRLAECFPAAIGHSLEAEIDRARLTGAPTYSERRIPFPKGARWMSAWLTPVDDGTGGLSSVMGVARDITQRHELGELLTRQHQLLNRLIEASPVGIMLLNFTDKWVCDLSNPVMRQLAGTPCLEGARFDEAWPALAGPLAPTLSLAATSDKSEKVDIELETKARGGRSAARHLSVTASRLQLPDHASSSVLLLVSDTTDQEELERQLLQADKMDAIGRLAGGIAHDFNNLLTPILGYTELVLGTLAEDDSRRRDLEEVCNAAKSASGLTRQLLTFSRKQMTEPARLDLNEVTRGLEGILRRTIGEDIRIELNLSSDVAAVVADRSHMEQVVMNLCVNARDAMPSGGLLTVETAEVTIESGPCVPRSVPPGRYVTLRIADTGVGMTPEVQARIFEPFFTTKGVDKGTGLGLSIVHGIVTSSGGYIDLASAPGEGTTFMLYFPQATGASVAERHRAAGATEKHEPTGGETILVVEDHDGLRRLAERLLRAEGYQPLVAQNAGEALEIAQGFPGPIHVLLTDVVMPGVDGITLSRQFARKRPDTRVLFMSGYSGNEVATHGALAGDIHLLQKPFTRATLAHAIKDTLARPYGNDFKYAATAAASS